MIHRQFKTKVEAKGLWFECEVTHRDFIMIPGLEDDYPKPPHNKIWTADIIDLGGQYCQNWAHGAGGNFKEAIESLVVVLTVIMDHTEKRDNNE